MYIYNFKGLIDLGLPKERDNAVGILVGTAEELLNYFYQVLVGGLKFPFEKVREMAGVLGGRGFRSFGDRLGALVEVLVVNSSAGATWHLQFFRGLAAIFYNMLVDLLSLWPAFINFINSPLGRTLLA